jgi:hypothetical protein
MLGWIFESNFDFLKLEILTYISKRTPCRTENTVLLYYKHQSLNALWGSVEALFVDISTKPPRKEEYGLALLLSRASKPVVEVHSASWFIGTGVSSFRGGEC